MFSEKFHGKVNMAFHRPLRHLKYFGNFFRFQALAINHFEHLTAYLGKPRQQGVQLLIEIFTEKFLQRLTIILEIRMVFLGELQKRISRILL